MNYQTHLTLKSSNAKTGPIPVSTTERKTCPTTCPFYDAGCYAGSGPLALHWRKVSNGERGHNWSDLCEQIDALPDGQLWRHNQAGDLPGDGETIDADAMTALVAANTGKNGFTYTHYPMTAHNASEVLAANDLGFTINLSANNLEHADELADLDIAPVVCVVPSDISVQTMGQGLKTASGRKVAICPATYLETDCSKCQLCAKRDRAVIVAFPAHGTQKRAADVIARG